MIARWLNSMERPALGFCGLSARQFDTMTPAEVSWRIEAETERENRAFERLAQLACWVMNPWISAARDKYSVGKLLKRRVNVNVQDESTSVKWWEEE